MKIIFLSTGRGLHPDFINELRTKIGLGDSDVVCLVSWHSFRNRLPVNRHLVLGPHLRLRSARATVQRVQRRPDPMPPADEVHLESSLETADTSLRDASSAKAKHLPAVNAAISEIPDPNETPSPTDHADLTDPSSLIDTSTRTRFADPTDHPSPTLAVSAARKANSTAHLPVLHPRRMRKAVLWRVRRIKKAARGKPASGLAAVRTHPQFRRVRNRLTPGVSLRFAASCLRAEKVHDMMRDSDLVVALDATSQLGAWTLAQKIPGPHVVIGLPAAKRIIDQREVSTAG